MGVATIIGLGLTFISLILAFVQICSTKKIAREAKGEAHAAKTAAAKVENELRSRRSEDLARELWYIQQEFERELAANDPRNSARILWKWCEQASNFTGPAATQGDETLTRAIRRGVIHAKRAAEVLATSKKAVAPQCVHAREHINTASLLALEFWSERRSRTSETK